MDVFLVFNELSAQDIDISDPSARYKAVERMERFVQLIRTARKLGVNVFRHDGGFTEIQLADGYSINEWLHDGTIDRDYRTYLRSCVTGYEYLTATDMQAIEISHEYDFSIDGRRAVGLGFAHLLGSLAVSFESGQQKWNTSSLHLTRTELDASLTEIIEKEEVVPHVSHQQHFETHRQWLNRRLKEAVTNGESLYEKLETWFPHLIFVDEVQRQIREMSAGTPQLRQVVDRLFALEHYCAGWTDGAFDADEIGCKVSPESESVSANPRLRKMREFKLPSGQVAYFEWHMRLTPDAWRLHFLPIPADRKIGIGYVGRHLETAAFR